MDLMFGVYVICFGELNCSICFITGNILLFQLFTSSEEVQRLLFIEFELEYLLF